MISAAEGTSLELLYIMQLSITLQRQKDFFTEKSKYEERDRKKEKSNSRSEEVEALDG